ncbi:helix-turn-helix domain-containing protein, partial [Myxococcota bacterium]|nr:helix-turn-helix domain-containing protein [Myxococcota bacterium]
MSSKPCSKCDHPETCNPQPAITAADIGTWPDVMDINQLVQALDVRSRNVIYRLVENQGIPFKRVGKTLKF